MKKIEIYAQIAVIPVQYPDRVQLQYRRASPRTGHVTKKSRYQTKPQLWRLIRDCLAVQESYLQVVDGYLKDRKPVLLGYNYVTLAVLDDVVTPRTDLTSEQFFI